MKISIITINYNNAVGLNATLDSVAAQTCREIEHVIIDGGSTDGSVEIIQNYVNQLKIEDRRLKIDWVSEKDKGIYDAMNKGIEIASGLRVVNAFNRSELVEDKNKVCADYLYFLNSGDTLASPIAMREMVDEIDGTDIIVGRVNKTNQGKIVGQTDLLSEKDMSLYNMYLRGINHQSALIKRELLVKIPYDASIKLNADWKFFVQTIVLGGATTKYIDKIFANYDVSGVSANTEAVIKEREQVLNGFIPERVARDYLAIAPHYYEVIRVEWLLKHPFFYRIYRVCTTIGRKIMK